MPCPFEVAFGDVVADLDTHVESVFEALASEFVTVPKGMGFVEYGVFEQGYEALKQGTSSFRDLGPEVVLDIVRRVPISFVVLRTMLGFSPPEWAYVTTQRTGLTVTQGSARTIDRTFRLNPFKPLRLSSGVTYERVEALVRTACELILEGSPEESEHVLHRLAKADTRKGIESVQSIADLGVPYAMLLYERLLGRPFASHRDSISELVGDYI